MMALLARAQAAHAAAAHADGPPPSMPARFVGVTGVYNIATHWAYERDRGVHTLSTMLPAVGGPQRFASQSPSVILAAALARQQQGKGQQQQGRGQQQQDGAAQEPPACGFYSSFPLAGDAISQRIGFERGADDAAAVEAELLLQSLEGMADVPEFPLAAAAFLPPTVLMSSCTDLTVPW